MQSSTFSIFLVSKVKNTKDMMVIGKKDELVEWCIFRIRVDKFIVCGIFHIFFNVEHLWARTVDVIKLVG